MSLDIEKAEYFNILIANQAGEETKLLSTIAGFGISLLAYKAVNPNPGNTLFSIFPNDVQKMRQGAERTGLKMEGPYPALIIEGDDEAGALADIFNVLSEANIKVNESCGIANINGNYGVILYLNKEDCNKALAVLKP